MLICSLYTFVFVCICLNKDEKDEMRLRRIR